MIGNKLPANITILSLTLIGLLGLNGCSDDSKDLNVEKSLTEKVTLAFGDDACAMGVHVF